MEYRCIYTTSVREYQMFNVHESPIAFCVLKMGKIPASGTQNV